MTRTAQPVGTVALFVLSCVLSAHAQSGPPQTASPTTVLDAEVALRGAPSPAHLAVQSWMIPEADHAPQVFPKKGYFIAHLLSGRMETKMGGRTVARRPDEYWSVGNGQEMTVRVLGQTALLETLTITAR
jgi:hypothetical protein